MPIIKVYRLFDLLNLILILLYVMIYNVMLILRILLD